MKQTLVVLLQSFEFDSDLLKAPKILKDFVLEFQHKKEIFDLQERYNNHNNSLDLVNKNSFYNNYPVDIFLFVTAIVLLVVTTIVMYILCKHMKLIFLVTSLALQQIKEVGVVAKQEHVSIAQDIECICKIQWYTIFMLSLSIFAILFFLIINARILKLFRGYLFSNAVKIMMFI